MIMMILAQVIISPNNHLLNNHIQVHQKNQSMEAQRFNYQDFKYNSILSAGENNKKVSTGIWLEIWGPQLVDCLLLDQKKQEEAQKCFLLKVLNVGCMIEAILTPSFFIQFDVDFQPMPIQTIKQKEQLSVSKKVRIMIMINFWIYKHFLMIFIIPTGRTYWFSWGNSEYNLR